jgi:hypothetical protein
MDALRQSLKDARKTAVQKGQLCLGRHARKKLGVGAQREARDSGGRRKYDATERAPTSCLAGNTGQRSGQGGDLEIFEARECEGLGWVTKVDGVYRLTEEGKHQLEEMAPKPEQR